MRMHQENIGRLEPKSPGYVCFSVTSPITFRTESLDRHFAARVRYKLVETTRTHKHMTGTVLDESAPPVEPHKTAVSVKVESPNNRDSDYKQDYIYRTTLARVPVTVKRFHARSRSAHELQSVITQRGTNQQSVMEKCAISRKVTVPLERQSFPPDGNEDSPRSVSQASFQLSPRARPTRVPISHYWRGEESSTQSEGFTVHIADKSSSLKREKLYYERHCSDSPQPLPTCFSSLLIPRSYHSLPKARNALVSYPKPGNLEVKPPFKGLGGQRLVDPLGKDLGRVHPSPHRQVKSYSDTDYAEFPSGDDRSPWFPGRPEEYTSSYLPPSVPEFPTAYKSPPISGLSVPTESNRDARRKPWYSDRQEDSIQPVGRWEQDRGGEEPGERDWFMGQPSDARGPRENEPTEPDRDARRKPWYSDRQEDFMQPVGRWEEEKGGEEPGDRDWFMGQPSDTRGPKENEYADRKSPPPDLEERKVSQFPTRKRHPPPPTSPTFQPPSSSARISDTSGRGQRPTDRPTRASPIQNGHYNPETSMGREVTETKPGDDQQSERERRKRGTKTPSREERPSQRGPSDSTGGKKQAAKLPVSPEDREGGLLSPTARRGSEGGRKQIEKEERRSGKESKRDTKPRHPPPPEASGRRREPAVNGYGGKVKPSTPRRTEPMFEDEDAEYVNFPGSIAPGAQPRDEELKRVTQETSDQSNEQSSYDPRVTEAMHDRHPAPVVMRRKDKSGEPSGTRAHVSPRKQKLPSPGKSTTQRQLPVQGYRTPRDDFEDEDDDDLESSEEDLKPPALISIPQTKKSSDSLVRGSQSTTGVQMRHSSRASPRGTLVSARGSTALSPGARISSGTWDRSSQGRPHGRYRPEQFHPQDYERASRPRSKRDTATSDRYGVSGSKHSMIISTKRRTLSGVTGVPPNRVRSSSMNTLWFGDHPLPRSADAVSLTAPLRLSTIQLQAQAELERRHRSSSRTRSLDRRSVYSVGGTESRLSRGAEEIEGYEGIGYGYDTRGRLIHGGANLHERAASRRRRLRDGHESLSRVWIPQSDGGSPTRHTNEPLPSDASRLDHRQSNLDESAVAFALRDFTSPGVGEEDHEDSIVYDDEDEHIYARPDSIQSETAPKPPERKQRPHSGQARSAKSHRTSNPMQVRLRRPKLLSTRCSSMPLPDAKQYESLMRLSTLSVGSSSYRSGKSTDRSKYLHESNV